ncbi:YtzI protein [Salirhabdus sp. Marseille-P4669]|uniref:YtzI protein n=1 Tax=Salirhabdus sp. Marseille-P4669 TaxID=2042310 RepID=UPI000C7B1351|nr:YtzI protein [Salirhabdus sp. Marseille-P4669]
MFWIILIISIVICVVVIAMSVITTNKAYAYRHKIDPIPEEHTNNSAQQKD